MHGTRGWVFGYTHIYIWIALIITMFCFSKTLARKQAWHWVGALGLDANDMKYTHTVRRLQLVPENFLIFGHMKTNLVLRKSWDLGPERWLRWIVAVLYSEAITRQVRCES